MRDDTKITQEIENFETRFDKLASDAQMEIEEKETSVKKFRHSLSRLPQSIRRDHLQFITENLSNLQAATSIDQLFMYLDLYTSFLDYSLLDHIVKRYGSEKMKKAMREYVQDLTEFRKITTVEQLVRNWSGRVEPPPNFSELKNKAG